MATRIPCSCARVQGGRARAARGEASAHPLALVVEREVLAQHVHREELAPALHRLVVREGEGEEHGVAASWEAPRCSREGLRHPAQLLQQGSAEFRKEE